MVRSKALGSAGRQCEKPGQLYEGGPPACWPEAQRHRGQASARLTANIPAYVRALVGEEMEAGRESIINHRFVGRGPRCPVEAVAETATRRGCGLRSPNWDMGQRIHQIDSASMLQQGQWKLIENQGILRRPRRTGSKVGDPPAEHRPRANLVGFRDGALMAHLGAPDMRHADRLRPALARDGATAGGAHRPWPRIATLEVLRPGQVRYQRAGASARRGGWRRAGAAGASSNADKEIALDGFIAGRIRLTCRWPTVVGQDA